jgi:hypothetical protein
VFLILALLEQRPPPVTLFNEGFYLYLLDSITVSDECESEACGHLEKRGQTGKRGRISQVCLITFDEGSGNFKRKFFTPAQFIQTKQEIFDDLENSDQDAIRAEITRSAWNTMYVSSFPNGNDPVFVTSSDWVEEEHSSDWTDTEGEDSNDSS